MTPLTSMQALLSFRETRPRLKLVRGEAEESKQNQEGFLELGGDLGVDMPLRLETRRQKKGTGLAPLILPMKQL